MHYNHYKIFCIPSAQGTGIIQAILKLGAVVSIISQLNLQKGFVRKQKEL